MKQSRVGDEIFKQLGQNYPKESWSVIYSLLASALIIEKEIKSKIDIHIGELQGSYYVTPIKAHC